MRAGPHARALFMAAASRGVVGPFVCVQRSLGRFPRVGPIRSVREGTVTASATARVELGFRRERTATNRQDEAQNATGESVLRVRSLSLSLSLPSVTLAPRAPLSGCHPLDRPRQTFRSLAPLARSTPRKLDPGRRTTGDRDRETERGCDYPSSRFPR